MPKKDPGTPSKSPSKPTPRTPKSSYKGDELGKNKKQSSLMQFFSPKDKESPIQLVSSKPKLTKEAASRKALFPNPSLRTDPIVISDEDSPRSPQPSIEQFHTKTKNVKSPNHVIKKENGNILSRKSQKLRTADSPAISSSKSAVLPEAPAVPSAAPTDDVIVIASSQSSQEDAEPPCPTPEPKPSPSKTFRKQFVADSEASDDLGNSVLKQITPSNTCKDSPSLLSTKSRKRKSPETPTPPLQNSPSKKAKSKVRSSENSPDPSQAMELEWSESSPKTNQCVSSALQRFSMESDSTPVKQKHDLDENDSSQMFTKSPLWSSPFPKADPPKPPGLRCKPLLDLLSPRYLTDEVVSSLQKGPSHVSEVVKPKTYQMPTALPPAKALAKSENPKGQNSASNCDKKSESTAGTVSSSRNVEQTQVAVSKRSDPPSGFSSNPTASKMVVEPTASSKPPLSLDEVDWSEPMEQEILHASPVKRPPSVESTPKKLNPNTVSKVPTPTTSGPSTPSKMPSTPSKSPKSGHPSSNPSTPRKSLYRSPRKATPKKFGSPFKAELTSGNLLLQHCIVECKRYAKMALKLNASNKKVVDDYLELDHPEKLLLHHLLMRKWSWIRQCDMNYTKFIPNLGNSLVALQAKGFVECISDQEDLEEILGLLKRPELVELSKSHKLDFFGCKNELIIRLANFANRQAGLGFTTKTLKSVMLQKAVEMVGRCVRIATGAREALQQIFEASMSPIFLEGNFYTFQERMRGMGELMDSVKFKNKKLVPHTLSDSQLFLTTSQFDEYISSTVMKFDLLAAKDRKDHVRGAELARDARSSLLIYVSSPSVQEFLDKMPRYVWRYTAGSNYTSAVDIGVEFFKKTKDFETAVLALDVLLAQGRFRKHCRGSWYAEKVLILDKHLKKSPQELYHVIMTGLKEDLTPIGRLELSKKAEMLLNRRKNGLDADQISEMRKMMRTPRLNHPVREIKSIEAPNVSTGTRQTFVEVSANGDKTYYTVEESAKNAYLDEYPEGSHDEGSLLKNIIIAAFWPVIYMPMDEMFVSMYQHSPLDWGTRLFYTNRKKEIKDHIHRLREGGVEGVMQQITDVITLYSNSHSLVDWFKIAHDTLPTIKNLLTCLTVDKFLLLADYLLEAFRERRSGWPDLTLWNTLAGTFKLVEVKSPNDELSFKQIVWLEKLLEMGIPVEECRVNSNKNKRRKAMAAQANSDASQEVL